MLEEHRLVEIEAVEEARMLAWREAERERQEMREAAAYFNTYDPFDPADYHDYVIFGETTDIILLRIDEWHTYQTWLDWIEEYRNLYKDMFRHHTFFTQMSEEEKSQVEANLEEFFKSLEDEATLIRNKQLYKPRFVNGIYAAPMSAVRIDLVSVGGADNVPFEIHERTELFDENGYYLFDVYPYTFPLSTYHFNDSEFMIPASYGGMTVNTKQEYDHFLENVIKPFYDDLAERDLLNPWVYDFYAARTNPTDHYIRMFFIEIPLVFN